jgi:hypothetical protein
MARSRNRGKQPTSKPPRRSPGAKKRVATTEDVANELPQPVLDDDNRHAFKRTVFAIVIILLVTQLHHREILHPSSIDGPWRYVAIVGGTTVIFLTTATVIVGIYTFFAIDRRDEVKRFHDSLGQRLALALLLATLVALQTIVFGTLDTDDQIDVVDMVGRITGVFTLIAISTCVWSALIALRCVAKSLSTSYW